MASTLPLTQQETELKKIVARSCRIVGRQGVTKGSFGHVSARLPGTNRILIKAKGPDEEALEFATERDVIAIDIDGNVLDAVQGLTAPNETAMHLAVLRRRPEVQSVIHSHPDWVVVLTATNKPLVPMLGAYDGAATLRAVVREGIPVYPRTLTIINDELGADFMNTMGEANTCLLRGHGMTTAGSSVEDATHRALQIYELARLNYLAYTIGTPEPVPQRDQDEYLARREDGPYRRERGPSSTGEGSFWKYQRKLLGEEL
ncbi:MAG: hypothetical protein QOF51_1084 [Chloroflexota bacterium]|jgi:ribulose-5-phosphate 4-epimerase/fuculose-1-phosphate aldolase|nr:hypothetical protein [Chloroflexota bacterium]